MRADSAPFASALSLVVAAFAIACNGGSEIEQPPAEPALYSVRGVVRQLSQDADGKTQISILHEAIPDFVGIDGEVVGMKSMTMPFAVAESVDLSGFDPGSRVEFDLSVDWNRSEPGLITRLEHLPEDAVLDFETVD